MLRKYARAHTSSTVKVSIIPDIGDLSSAFSVSGNLISTLVVTMRGTVPCVRKGSAICFVWHLLQQLSFLSSVLPLAFLFTTVPLILLLPLYSLAWKPDSHAPTLFFLLTWWVRYSGWSKSLLLIVSERKNSKRSFRIWHRLCAVDC